MTERELLPCPFCGSNRLTVWNIRDGQQAVCKDCHATGAPAFNGPQEIGLAAYERAVTAWNTRAHPDEGEAVAWRYQHAGRWYVTHEKYLATGGGPEPPQPLFAHPPRSPEPWRAPEGFEAQLAERLSDPEWIAKWNVAEEKKRSLEWLLHRLRHGEGSTVTLLSDNPDFNGQPNNAIECCGAWTNWEERRFTGESIRAAVLAAYRAMISAAPPAPLPGKAAPPIDTEEVGS